MSRTWIGIAGALALAALAGCESCAPGQVADGVSRLTVRNAGAILELINDDARCGFASAAVKAKPIVSGTPGAQGTATWSVSCTIDMPELTAFTQDCRGVKKKARGKLEVTATRTVQGLLTGDPANPVIPGGPDAVLVSVQRAAFDHFYVEQEGNGNTLEMISGSVSFDAQPRLGVSETTGACSVPTPNILFTAIAYESALVHVTTPDRSFDVPVPTSALSAVVGQHSGFENAVQGDITVWDSPQVLPDDLELSRLDPDYEAETYQASYACEEDLKVPLSFTCEGIGAKIAQGASRLTVRAFGAMGTLLDLDTRCGFSSPAVLARAEVMGQVGGLGAIVLRAEECTLSFDQPAVGGETCGGVKTLVTGAVTVSATKTLRGRITGDPTTPIVPMSNMPATVEVSRARFDRFRVEKEGTAIVWVKGEISGRVSPETVMQASTGACGFKTQNARFEDLSYKGAELALETPSGRLGVKVRGSSLYAVNGQIESEVNVLRGTMQVDKDTHAIPVDPADPGLEPGFSLAAFEASWQCGDLVKPVSRQCNFVAPIVQGSAQLTVNLFGAALKLAEADPRCGFNSMGVLRAAQAAGNLGDDGSTVTLSIATPCTMTFAEPTEIAKDCRGVSTMVQGTVAITGTKKLRGFLSGDPAQPIVPTSRDPAEIDLAITGTRFSAWTTPLANKLTLVSGQLAGKARPRTAIDRATGACSIPTPVAAFTGLAYTGATLELFSQGKTFRAAVARSSLEAVNGSRDGVTNLLRGSIAVDGADFPIPIAGPPVLDPAYDPAAFDASFACTPNLVVPPADEACSMRATLAEGAARLLIQGLGGITKWVNADDECGFQDNLTNPTRVTGRAGEIGQMEWAIQNCRLSRAPTAGAYSEDCLGRKAMMSGAVTISGARTVTGRREEIGILFLTFDSIAPVTRTGVHVALDSVQLNEFSYYELDRGQTLPSKRVFLHGGVITASADPVTGENRRNAGVFDIPTPISHFTSVRVSAVPMTIYNQGKTFNVRLDDAELEAMNGAFGGRANEIRGRVVLDGRTFMVGPGALNPEYNQADFDARYACTDNLRAVVPPR